MFGDHPFKDKQSGAGIENVPRCPKCRGNDFDARQTEFEILRTCRKCGTTWSGGSVGAARPTGDLPPPPGVPAPEDDLPCNNFTGAAFRPWE